MIEFSNRINLLIEVFGLTNNVNEAGYILEDASLLNMNRTNSFKRKNHLDVLKVLPEFTDFRHTIIDTDMIAFMAQEKLVRFSIEGQIHTAVKPTSLQIRKIYSMLAYRSNSFEIILSDSSGITLSQQRVSGPSMATLVDIFNLYGDKEYCDLLEDEFTITDDLTHYYLIFRPSMQIVGRMNKNTKMIKMDLKFNEMQKMFVKLVNKFIFSDEK